MRIVGEEIPVQYVGEQDHAVEVDVLFLQRQRHPRRAHRSVAFAIEIFRRFPATIFRQEIADEDGEGVDVLVDAEPGLVLVFPRDAAETRSGGVDETVGHVEQICRCDGAIGRAAVRQIGRLDAHGTIGAHVKPERRGPRAAVEEEGDRPGFGRRAFLEIGGVEHRRFGIGNVFGRILVALAFVRHRVVPALRMDDERSRDRAIGDGYAADRHRSAAFNRGREKHRRVGRGLVGGRARLFRLAAASHRCEGEVAGKMCLSGRLPVLLRRY